MPTFVEKRSSPFNEKLSWLMAIVAAAGGTYVILDPVITLKLDWIEVKLGGDGFAEQLKGAVVALILIEGWKAVKEYWLGASKSGDVAQASVSTIAQAAAPAAAAAVAAATGSVPNGAVTPAPLNPATGVIPAAETVFPKDLTK